MKVIARMTVAAALLLSPLTLASAQAPGTTGGGGSNASPTSGAIDSGTIDRPGTGVSVAPVQPAPATPPASAAQPPPPAATAGSTAPPPITQRPAAAGGSRTVGQSGRATNLRDPKEDPVIQQTEQEVSKRIKSICKGC
jgi:hypothetical protein